MQSLQLADFQLKLTRFRDNCSRAHGARSLKEDGLHAFPQGYIGQDGVRSGFWACFWLWALSGAIKPEPNSRGVEVLGLLDASLAFQA